MDEDDRHVLGVILWVIGVLLLLLALVSLKTEFHSSGFFYSDFLKDVHSIKELMFVFGFAGIVGGFLAFFWPES